MSALLSQIDAAAREGKLLPASAKNIAALLASSPAGGLYEQSVAELADGGHWDELNDRFFRTLAFGTGGLRGRTIGKIVTQAEQGEPQALDRPQYPCVGTNSMNYLQHQPRDAGAGEVSQSLGRRTRPGGQESPSWSSPTTRGIFRAISPT